MHNNKNNLDINTIIKRIIKYIVEGIAVALAARYFPTYKIDINDIALIAFTAASVFAILDIYSPTIGIAARHGAGLAIGSVVGGGVNKCKN